MILLQDKDIGTISMVKLEDHDVAKTVILIMLIFLLDLYETGH
jgi:hypothetical protein